MRPLGFTSRTAFVLHRVLLRTSRTPLAKLWKLAYAVTARLAATYLIRGETDAATYLRGSFGSGDFVSGLSDLDLAIVVAEDPAGPGVARDRVSLRWQRYRRALPLLDLVVNYPRIHEVGDLAALNHASALTYGLDGPGPPEPGYFGDGANPDRVRMLERPGLYDSTLSWTPLKGPDRRPPEPARDPQLHRIAAWLELVQWWQWAVPACIDSKRPTSALMCAKLVAEPARIWLWLAHGERPAGREEALRSASRWLPVEEEAFRRALVLHRSLSDLPEPSFEHALPVLVRLSARIAMLIATEIEDEGATDVRLAGADPAEVLHAHGTWERIDSLPGDDDPRELPLCDWRSLVVPGRPDRTFVPLSADPGDPTVLAAAGGSRDPGPEPALEAGGIMVFPSARRSRSRLRAVQCPASDPVSFALARGEPIARFPRVRGWSAEDTARHAIAEHEARLESPLESTATPGDAGDRLALLLTATRAALFLETIEEGEPVLPVTVTEAARRLAEQSSAARAVAEDALGAYRDFLTHGTRPPEATLSQMQTLVRCLPPYAGRG